MIETDGSIRNMLCGNFEPGDLLKENYRGALHPPPAPLVCCKTPISCTLNFRVRGLDIWLSPQRVCWTVGGKKKKRKRKHKTAVMVFPSYFFPSLSFKRRALGCKNCLRVVLQCDSCCFEIYSEIGLVPSASPLICLLMCPAPFLKWMTP